MVVTAMTDSSATALMPANAHRGLGRIILIGFLPDGVPGPLCRTTAGRCMSSTVIDMRGTRPGSHRIYQARWSHPSRRCCELRPYRLGALVIQLVEDGNGRCPGGSRVVDGAVGQVRVAEVLQRLRLAVADAERAVQGDGGVVAGDCPAVVVGQVVDVTQAVPGGRLPVSVTEFVEQGECLAAGVECLSMVTELCLAPADAVEGIGLTGHVSRRAGMLQRTADGIARLGVALVLF